MELAKLSILIVEDDAEIRTLVADHLRNEEFSVTEAANGAEIDAMLSALRPDLLILDIMLPGEDGLSICRRVRARSNLPILMLTAKGDEIDRIVGLEMGADDYLVKPFSTRELFARVKALIRRSNIFVAAQATRRYRFDRFLIDLDVRQVTTFNHVPISLTTAEFDLLACFVTRPRRVLTRDQILDWTRGRSCEPFDRTVDVLMSRLRRKLELASPGSNLINTVRNGGYLFTSTVQQVPE